MAGCKERGGKSRQSRSPAHRGGRRQPEPCPPSCPTTGAPSPLHPHPPAWVPLRTTAFAAAARWGWWSRRPAGGHRDQAGDGAAGGNGIPGRPLNREHWENITQGVQRGEKRPSSAVSLKLGLQRQPSVRPSRGGRRERGAASAAPAPDKARRHPAGLPEDPRLRSGAAASHRRCCRALTPRNAFHSQTTLPGWGEARLPHGTGDPRCPELWVPPAPKGAPHGAHPRRLAAGFAGLRTLPEPAEGAQNPASLRQPLSKPGRDLTSVPTA